MLRRLLAVCLVSASCACSSLVAQTPSDPPAAPVPAQILAAKKIFISNASGETLSGAAASDLTYNGFYAAIKAWGRFDLVSAPTDADVIFEIRYETSLGSTNVLGGSGTSSTYPQIRLSIFDPKTHVVLWAFSELMVSTKHQSDREHLDETLANVVNDLKRLVARNPVGVAAAAK